ncbi:hypothetical protein COI53_08555 [Bacillus thuringiensis]|uniref:DUF6414 family protein n=1 Tax=Bacillus thuringiensis TaxID=1428 RepID=UPI000BF9D487|nr:hypothetical protein [Bacillus thuringiensis]PFI32200.1 hypothetical protein COI53_08555 [Bacillus thuringiensis]
MISELKDYYYLDERTLNSYVSAIEDGVVKTIQSSVSNSSPKWNFNISTGELQKVLAAMGIPIPSAGIQRDGKTNSISINQTRESTPQSLFSRLEKYLEPAMQSLEGFDKETWNQLEEGQFVKFFSEVELSKGYEMGSFLSKVGDFLDLARDLNIDLEGTEGVGEIDNAVKYGNKAIDKKTHKVLLKPIGSPDSSKYFFVSGMNIKFLDIDLEELPENTYTVVGRVERILKPGEKYTIFDPTLSGMSTAINRQQLRAQSRSNPDNGFNLTQRDMFAMKPAIVLKPIAIYK